MLAMQLLFVLFEKLGESFFDAGQTQHRRNSNMKNTPLAENHSNHYHFNIYLWEN